MTRLHDVASPFARDVEAFVVRSLRVLVDAPLEDCGARGSFCAKGPEVAIKLRTVRTRCCLIVEDKEVTKAMFRPELYLGSWGDLLYCRSKWC